ncbi:zinc finger MIZ domain-containing protein 2-like isoform X1 [Neodiprion virginianus]|uniref:zinc finger MIZ domain-containing protein 2-like isoform X1 n=2 Tax=Neodiprion virginianus TaxID=2961670 RepID=UPI001EE73788|nr:zinc finger MIZ domain-containing protein 2-like isoform X1 [Neodiprion virginianus]
MFDQLSWKESIEKLLLEGIVSKEKSMARITKILSTNTPNNRIQSEINQDTLELEVMEVELPLKCPLSLTRITIPARGCNCEHIQCFDLQYYVMLNYKVKSWKCPICNKNVGLKDLSVDEYIFEILEITTSMSDVERVVIDLTARWKIKISKPNVIDLTSEGDKDCQIIHSIVNLSLE